MNCHEDIRLNRRKREEWENKTDKAGRCENDLQEQKVKGWRQEAEDAAEGTSVNREAKKSNGGAKRL
jgi:hypothetical protein